jgi:hypothetical protein
VHDRFSLWAKTGVLTKVFKRLRRKLPLGKIFYLDSTVKSAKGGKRVGRAVKVKGSKISLVAEEAGLPVDLRLDSANRHDLYACGKLVEKCPKGSFIVIVADRGYDASWFRRKLWLIHRFLPRVKSDHAPCFVAETPAQAHFNGNRYTTGTK